MTDTNRYEIVYDSDFIIDDPVELSTLCVFYDKVYLPCMAETPKRWAQASRLHVDPDLTNHSIGWTTEVLWEKKYQLFFDEGVFSRLDVPWAGYDAMGNSINLSGDKPPDERQWNVFERILKDGDKYTTLDEAIKSGYLDKWEAYGRHLERSDISLPRLSTENPAFINRETLKMLLADKAFRYVLPALSGLHPESVLEVRRKVTDVREGFSMHLQTLTADIDAQLKDGESAEEIARYAQNVVETKLEPQYVEFKRQLGAVNMDKAGKVLDVVGRVFEIDASLLSPKFYVEMLKFGKLLVTGGAEELKDSLSNERQAYYFMHLVENTDVDRE